MFCGSSAAWPDRNIMLPQRIPWASGDGVSLLVNPVVGVVAEVMISLGMDNQTASGLGMTVPHLSQVRNSSESKKFWYALDTGSVP